MGSIYPTTKLILLDSLLQETSNNSKAMKVLLICALFGAALSEVYFEEKFGAGWEDRWVQSTHKGADAGKFVLSAGKFYSGPNGTATGHWNWTTNTSLIAHAHTRIRILGEGQMHTALSRVFVCVFVCVLVCVCEWKEELLCYIVSIIYNVKGIVNSFFSLALICCCARVPACKFEKKK